ncbi:MAG: carboxymuconolactone decarboxylase family protein [Methanobacteriota archaeon]|nr:MAG: carboxymuconolactone decarboxylase family protein [Euryarchaeota archaeon]
MGKDTGPPKRYMQIKEKYPEVIGAYEKLGDAIKNAGPLDEKTISLIKIGIAIGTGSEGSLHSSVRKALGHGATADEIRHAIFLSTTQVGFAKMMAALSWADDILES